MKPTKALFGILTVTAALAIQVHAQTLLTNGLVAYYPFNGNANDASGNGNNGQALNAVLTTDRSGVSGHAYQFNGVNANILAANQSYLSFPDGGDFTISIWVALSSMPTSTMHLIGMDNGAFDNPKWILSYGQLALPAPFARSSNYVHFITMGAHGAGQSYFLASTLYTPALGTWHQYVVSKEGTDYTLYIDGLKASGATNYMNDAGVLKVGVTGPSAIPSGITAPLSIGWAEGGGWVNGKLDDVRIYNRALAASEVQQLYAYESVPSCVSPPAGLVGWWRGEGDANDITGTNNATLLNGATFAPGEVGSAFSFNGSNQCVQVPYSQTLVASNYSVEAWIEPLAQVSGGINQAVIFGQSFGCSLLIARPGNSGVATLFGFGTSHVTFNWVASTNEIPIGQFSHLVGTWDGTTLRLYVNGVFNAQSVPGVSPVDSGCPFSIGGLYTVDDGSCNYVGQFFNGLIDEVSYYNRTLSGGEVQALYDAGSAGKCAPPNCTPPPSGLVGWWPGEGNANDIAGTDNGSLLNGATFAPGEVGSAFNCNGGLDSVVVPDSASLRLTNQFTIEAWINTRTTNVDQVILSKLGITGGNNGYALFFSKQNLLSAEFNRPGQSWPGNVIAYANSSAIVPNSWYHVAWTYDQSAMKLYLNGLPVATNVIGAQAIAVSTNSLHIGSVDDNNPVGFDGLIDEPSIYNRALSDGEITAIYNAGSMGKCAPPPRVATASAVVVNGFVVAANITDGGYGYTNTPTVRIIGGGGSGAEAVAVMSNGVVIAVSFLDAGSGYTSTPLIVIDPPFIEQPTMGIEAMSLLSFTNLALGTNYQLQSFLGNTWTNLGTAFTAAGPGFTQYVSGTADPNGYRLVTSPAPLQAFATAQVVNGFVVGAIVTGGGSGYITSPAVTIVGGGGTNATAVANLSAGEVTSITITDAGIGYTNAPTVRIAPPPAAGLSPAVLPVMRVDSASLAPYDNYQIQFKPDLGGAWGNWNGGSFSPTDVTNSQYLFITSGVGFFRLQYQP